VLEPERIRWALPAILLTCAFLALPVSATLPDPTSALPPGPDPEVPSAPTAPEALATARGLASDAKAQAEATAEEAKGRLPEPGSPANPKPGQAPVPQKVEALAENTLQPVRALLPQDAVGFARATAEQAARLPQQVLQPPSSDTPQEAEVAPQSVAPETVPRYVQPALLLAAGAAATATFLGFWLAGSSGAVAGPAAAGAAKASELRRLLPFASPLFTRFERDTVLGHPRREALYSLILQEPGISLQALGEATGLSRTAVIHHLRLMETQHLIVSRRVGRSRHYFENGGRYGHDQKEAYAILQNDRSKAVAEFIRGHPGAMQKMLCEALGIQPSIAHWHVRRLEEAHIVESIRQGRTVAYFPGPGLAAMDPTAAAQSKPQPQSSP